MTALGKALFSLLLVGAGFLLASVFGPPDLADNLADRMTLGRPADPWGDLRPAEASAAPDTWATFAPRFDPQAPSDAGLQRVDQTPSFAPTPYAATPYTPTPYATAPTTPAPTTDSAWPNQPPRLEVAPPPAASFANTDSAKTDTLAKTDTRQDTAVRPAAADERQLVGDRYARQAAWPTTTQTAAAGFPPQPASPSLSPNAPPITSPAMTTPPAARQANAWPRESYRSASYRRAAPPAGAWSQALRDETQPAPSLTASSLPNSSLPNASRPVATQPFTPSQAQPSAAPQMAETPQFAAPSALGWPAPVATIGLPQADAGNAMASRGAASARVFGPGDFAGEPRTHIVADGDTLAGIAQRYLGDPSRAADLFAWNRSVLGNPQLLPIGVELAVDGPAGSAPPNASAGQNGAPAGNTPGMTPVGAASPNPAAPRARLLAPQSAGFSSAGFSSAGFPPAAGFAQSAGFAPTPTGPRYGVR